MNHMRIQPWLKEKKKWRNRDKSLGLETVDMERNVKRSPTGIFTTCFFLIKVDFPGGSDGKVSVYNVGDLGSIPGSGRFAGEGNGNPLQYYCLENPMDRGAW